ncbi:MAG: hypothetical protein RR022_02945 [Angelakisella sp.]
MVDATQTSCGDQKENTTCTSVSAQYMDVSVPIWLRPFATVGTLKTECCSEPVLSLRSCQGTNGSCGCELTITQTICVRIPVEYDTYAEVGEPLVCCKKSQPCCNNFPCQ